MDSMNIIHADIKPDNIMLAGTGRIKLIDLGCALHASQAGINTYIQTRFYRAPEILLGMTQTENLFSLWGLSRTVLYMPYITIQRFFKVIQRRIFQ